MRKAGSNAEEFFKDPNKKIGHSFDFAQDGEPVEPRGHREHREIGRKDAQKAQKTDEQQKSILLR